MVNCLGLFLAFLGSDVSSEISLFWNLWYRFGQLGQNCSSSKCACVNRGIRKWVLYRGSYKLYRIVPFYRFFVISFDAFLDAVTGIVSQNRSELVDNFGTIVRRYEGLS